MEMPKPGEPHRQLQKLVGNWSGEEKLSPSPWDPKGGTAIGRVNNRAALDGFAVIQDYEQERNGKISFRGHGIFSYDLNRKCHVLHWQDSMGFPVNEFTGGFQGDVLTLTNQGIQGHNRCTFDVSRGGYSFKMEVSADGKQWVTFMEGKYTKK